MNDTQLKAVGGEKAFFLKPETYELIRTAAQGTIVPDEAHFSMERRGNRTFFSLLNPGAVGTYPFKITNASTELDGCRVTLAKGEVSSSYGTGPYPTNLWPDPDEPLYLSVTADTMYVRLVSTITTGETPAIDRMEIDITDTLDNDTDTVAYLIIGRVVSAEVEGTRQISEIFNNVRDNLAHSLAFEGYSYPDYWRQMIGPVS